MTDIPGVPSLFGADLAAMRPRVSSRLAAQIIEHRKAGADAPFIAALLSVGLSEVLSVIDSLDRGRSWGSLEPVPEQVEHQEVEPATAHRPSQKPSPAALIKAAIEHTLETAKPDEVIWPEHDVELNALQTRAIRYTRRKLGLSVDRIARLFRIRPEQVERICGDAPPLPTNTGVENAET